MGCNKGRIDRRPIAIVLMRSASNSRVVATQRSIKGSVHIIPHSHPTDRNRLHCRHIPLLGPAFAIIRPVAALVTAFIGGMAVNREDKTSGTSCDIDVDTIDAPASASFGRRIIDALRYGFVEMIQNIGKWLIIGLVIAAAITVFIPDGFFTFLLNIPCFQ